MANCVPPVMVRIKGSNSDGKDWVVPTDVNFRMVLVSRLTPTPAPPPAGGLGGRGGCIYQPARALWP